MFKQLFKKTPEVCGAVVVAAGTASRMKGTDKIMVQLDQEPLVTHTIRAFQENQDIDLIVVVSRQELLAPLREICQKNGFGKVLSIVKGGSSRPESVMAGLDVLAGKVQYAAIHDGARPLVTQEIISNTVQAARRYHAAAPAVPVKDTIKIAKNHLVVSTPARSSLFAIQTPQVFDFDLLRGALQKAITEKLPITDDCSAVETIGMSIYLTEGSDENIKVTTPIDLLIADAILKNRRTL